MTSVPPSATGPPGQNSPSSRTRITWKQCRGPVAARPAGGRGERLGSAEFRGHIDRRLSLVFGALFLLVLLVGSASLYLLGSLLLKSDEIAKGSEQVFVAHRIGRSMEDFLDANERAVTARHALTGPVREPSLAQLQALLTRYRVAGGAEHHVREIQQILSSADALAQPIVAPDAGATPLFRAPLDPDAIRSDALRHRMDALVERISADHERSEGRQVEQAHRQLTLTVSLNVAFLIVGTVMLVAAQRYFRRSIAVPLSELTERSSEIARGGSFHEMPISSNDEVGRLTQAFNRMARQLKEHEARLTRMAIIEERHRLARELHDQLAQDLAFLRIKLVEMQRSLGAPAPSDSQRLVAEMFAGLDGAYQDLREAIFGLRARAFDASAGLAPALAEYLEDFSVIRKLPVRFQVSGGNAIELAPDSEIQLIRIIHEALTNVVKHAGASAASVTIDKGPNVVAIAIEDDGRGFASEQGTRGGLQFGLSSMRDRAAAAGGTLAIQSTPGHGTRVVLELPLARS